jgi:hypothetical protein
MFKWPDYPDSRVLVAVLLSAIDRLNDAGAVNLTQDEVAHLQQAGYTAVLAPGWWSIPRLSLDLLRPHPSLARLATHWYGPRALDPPSEPVTPQPERIAMTLADRLRWRVHDALRKPDQARVLRSLAGQPDGQSSKRDLQRRLRRLPADRLNPALDGLVRVGLVAWEKVGAKSAWLMLSVEVLQALAAAGVGVRPPKIARAMRRVRATSQGSLAGNITRTTGRTAAAQYMPGDAFRTTPKRPYRPHPIPDRRRHPRQWGKAMRRRLGGLTVQRLYRKFGVHPTAAATAARQRKRSQQARRQAASNTPAVTHAAPVTSSAVPRAPSVSYSTTTAAAISAARAYQQPIGRRERLAAEQRRR